MTGIMSLDDNQKNTVRQWIEDGLQLNDIQKKLADELGVSMTYMDLRFLLSDLALTPRDEEEETEDSAAEAEDGAGAAPDSPEGLDDELPGEDMAGDVSVTVDELTRPGYMISGRVTFTDGKRAEWFIDQMGRPGINPEDPDYRPTQEDIMKFQTELQRILSRSGY